MDPESSVSFEAEQAADAARVNEARMAIENGEEPAAPEENRGGDSFPD